MKEATESSSESNECVGKGKGKLESRIESEKEFGDGKGKGKLESRIESEKEFGDETVSAWKNPQQRRLVSLNTEETVRGSKFTVLTYNVLADVWATSEKHQACPKHALKWNFRRQKLVSEIIAYNADIICLQEVQRTHLDDFFNPLKNHGYDGRYWPKSGFQQEGCATFFRSERFCCVDSFNVKYGSKEFCDLAATKLYTKRDDSQFNQEYIEKIVDKRFGSKDNIALIHVLSFDSNLICVANTHLVASGHLPDVKMWQSYCLLRKIQEVLAKKGNDMPVVICGDFNSLPGSAAHSFLVQNKIDPEHKHLQVGKVLRFDENKLKRSSIDLSSAYSAYFNQGISSSDDDDVMKRWMDSENKEPTYTHYAFDFKGTLDYIFYTHNNLKVEKLLEIVDWDTVSRARDKFIPSRVWPSDHIALLAQFSCIDDNEDIRKRKRQAEDDSHDSESATKSSKIEST